MKNLQTSSKKWGQLLLVILISFFSGVLGTFTTLQLSQKQNTNPTNTTTVSKTAVKNENSTTQAVDKVKDAVVSVITYSANSQNSLFGSTETDTDTNTEQVSSEGSGVIYKKEGNFAYLVTNTHVINGAKKVDIRLADGTKVPGEIVGSDTYSDIAVVKIAADKVTTVAEFGDSDQLTVGETAIAIGSPLGSEYANTVTQGIVSSLNRKDRKSVV